MVEHRQVEVVDVPCDCQAAKDDEPGEEGGETKFGPPHPDCKVVVGPKQQVVGHPGQRLAHTEEEVEEVHPVDGLNVEGHLHELQYHLTQVCQDDLGVSYLYWVVEGGTCRLRGLEGQQLLHRPGNSDAYCPIK